MNEKKPQGIPDFLPPDGNRRCCDLECGELILRFVYSMNSFSPQSANRLSDESFPPPKKSEGV
jgi:hypothetical protein